MQVLNRLRVSVLTLVLLGLMTALAGADTPLTVFVGKAGVSGVVRNGRVFAPGDALLRAMGCAWTVSANDVVLTAGKTGGPALPRGRVVLRQGSAMATTTTIEVNGQVWVDARAVAEGLGGFYIYTPSVGVAQISFSKDHLSRRAVDKAVKQAEGQAKADAAKATAAARKSGTAWQDGASSGGSSGGSDSDEGSSGGGSGDKSTKAGPAAADDEPVAVDRVVYSVGQGGQVRGTIVLKNDATVAIRHMLVYVTIQAPDTSSGSDLPRASGQGGTASLPSYVKDTSDGSLPTYGGVPPSSVSSSYPEMANGGHSTTAPPLSSKPSPSPEVSPQASPTPAPMHDVTTLPAIFVDEIGPGQTLSLPFAWNNPQRLPQVSPTVRTQHDKVEFTRKKEKSEDASAGEEGAKPEDGAKDGEKPGDGSKSGDGDKDAPKDKDASKGDGG